MEGDNILVGQAVQLPVHFLPQIHQLHHIGHGIVPVLLLMLGVCLAELAGDGLHLLNGIGHGQPDMGIVLLPLLQEMDIVAPGSINDFQVLLLGSHFIQKALHAGPVHHQGISPLQGLQILGGKLVVMEAPCLGLGHIHHLHSLYPLGDIQHLDIYGVK